MKNILRIYRVNEREMEAAKDQETETSEYRNIEVLAKLCAFTTVKSSRKVFTQRLLRWPKRIIP